MKIQINGKPHVTEHTRLDVILIEFVTTDGSPFAIAVNETFVAKSLYKKTFLKEGDRIEILTPMQGG